MQKLNRHIITITGDLASGKSKVTTLLANELGYEIYRNGDYVRKLAKEKGMDITQFNEYVKQHPEIDNVYKIYIINCVQNLKVAE